MSDIIKLIKENRLNEIIQSYSKSNLRIHELLVDILKDNLAKNEEEFNFEIDNYQKEFIEGVEIFKSLKLINQECTALLFSEILIYLGFKIGEYIHIITEKATNKNAYFWEISDYRIDQKLRKSIQDFYDSMNNEVYLYSKVIISTAKVEVSTAMVNKILKSEFSYDILQMGISYQKINKIKTSIKIYQDVIRNLESESTKLSSNLIPNLAQVDDRSEDEIKIYNKAKKLLEDCTGEKLEEPKRAHISENQNAKLVYDRVNIAVEQQNTSKLTEIKNRIKGWFK